MLQIEGLSAGYGPVVVLRDVHLEVRPGEMVGLLGRNGAGKTTLISAVAGLLKRAEGSVRLNGTELASLSAHQRVVHGLALCPSGGRLFKSLTVSENLTIGLNKPDKQDLAKVLALFPELERLLGRYAGKLSGGERQMVAIGRAILLRPSLLLLDEPSEGLAPIIVLRLVEALRRLREDRVSAIVAEQNERFVTLTCDRFHSIEKGHVQPVAAMEHAITHPASADHQRQQP